MSAKVKQDAARLSDERLFEYVANVSEAVELGVNVGLIMLEKKAIFLQELIKRGWRFDGDGDLMPPPKGWKPLEGWD